MYILDANVFITASNGDFMFSSCPDYWDWLALAEQQGLLISIQEIRQEINKADTKEQKALLNWCHANEKLFMPTTYKDWHFNIVDQWVKDLRRPYVKSAIAAFLDKPDSDLITEALARNSTVVTYEVSQPYRQGQSQNS